MTACSLLVVCTAISRWNNNNSKQLKCRRPLCRWTVNVWWVGSDRNLIATHWLLLCREIIFHDVRELGASSFNVWNGDRGWDAAIQWFACAFASSPISMGTHRGWSHFGIETLPWFRRVRIAWNIWPNQCSRWWRPHTLANKCWCYCSCQMGPDQEEIRKFFDRPSMLPGPVHFDLSIVRLKIGLFIDWMPTRQQTAIVFATKNEFYPERWCAGYWHRIRRDI